MDFKNITKSFISLSTPKMLRDWVSVLLNKVEEVEHDKKVLEEKNEILKAQVRQLQGLPAKPKFNSADKTSELDKDNDDDDDTPENKMRKRRKKAAQKKRRKKKDLIIDKTKKLIVNPDDLDSTFEYKGTRKVIVQDIIFHRNNIEFELEKFYSKEHGKTVEADLPPGYEGGYFGPHIIAFIKCSYYEGDVTIKKIHKILTSIGSKISVRQINRIINDRPDQLVDEMEDARVAGIEKADFQQIDDTGVKVLEAGSQSIYTTVTCNPYFTNLYTSLNKNRSNAIIALAGGNKKPLYKMNLQAIIVTFFSTKSLKIQLIMEKHQGERVYDEDEVIDFFKQKDFEKFKPKILKDIKTAMLVGAYYDGHLGITGGALVSDDAGQFNNIYDDHVLCWYHEMRHYKDLLPLVKEHELQLKFFFKEIKEMYRVFKIWTNNRNKELRDYIFRWFNVFFQEKTGYKLLDDRKKMSFNKMEKLLAPLFSNIKLPLENNESERDLRGRSIKNNKISLFDQTWAGAKARDLYISLKQTCRKNRVSFYKFLLDRQKKMCKIPQLSEIISSRIPQS
jgi:hypothetical protein